MTTGLYVEPGLFWATRAHSKPNGRMTVDEQVKHHIIMLSVVKLIIISRPRALPLPLTHALLLKDLELREPRFTPSMGLDVQAHSFALSCFSVALISFCAIRNIQSYGTAGTKKLPPGPKGIPFLGNLFQLSMTPWKEFEIWKKQYGKSTRTILGFPF